MPLSYVIRKGTPNNKDRKIMDVQIIHQESFLENMFTIDPRKVINILKELTFGTHTKKLINELKCVRKAMQDIQAHYYGM